jgi:phosphoribosylanthranilate isomerase
MRVKICGITNLEDALYAIECGADALGFVFYEKSPRYISPNDAKEIIKLLPPFVERVGLFVNQSAMDIETISNSSQISIAQIHFDVDEEFLDSIDFKTLPVVRAKEPQDLLKYPNRYKLVDAYTQAYGGSGKRLNIEWFEGMDNSKTILAGGLDSQNVSDVIDYGFYGVDVSSGVEKSHGLKDKTKVKQFIQNAKNI